MPPLSFLLHLLFLLSLLLVNPSTCASAPSFLPTSDDMRDKSIAFFKTDFGVGLINGGIAGFATARVQSVVYNAAIMASAATAGSVALGYMERDDVFSNARDMTSKAYSIYENNEEELERCSWVTPTTPGVLW